MNRRDLFALTVAGAVGSALPGCGIPEGLRGRVDRAKPLARRYFGDADPDAAEALGFEVLATTDGSEAAVLALVEPALAVLEARRSGRIPALEAQVAGEFSALAFAEMHGWVCAPTELALAAILAY